MDDVFTDADLADLKQEIVRDVTQTLMFGAVPGPAGHMPTVHEQAGRPAWTWCPPRSCIIPRRPDTSPRLAASGPDNPDGALHFACLLGLAGCWEGAQFWWQFSAGAGNAVAAHCRTSTTSAGVSSATPTSGPEPGHHPRRPREPRSPHQRRPVAQREPRLPRRLHEAVRRLKVDTVEDFGMGKVPYPDSHLVDQAVEELTTA